MRSAFDATGREVLGCRQRQHKPWILDDTIKKIEERRETKHKVIQARTRAQKQRQWQEYSECDKEVQRRIKETLLKNSREE